eukprot:1160745-Pelagomonas_calceolata.AAC.2
MHNCFLLYNASQDPCPCWPAGSRGCGGLQPSEMQGGWLDVRVSIQEGCSQVKCKVGGWT